MVVLRDDDVTVVEPNEPERTREKLQQNADTNVKDAVVPNSALYQNSIIPQAANKARYSTAWGRKERGGKRMPANPRGNTFYGNVTTPQVAPEGVVSTNIPL